MGLDLSNVESLDRLEELSSWRLSFFTQEVHSYVLVLGKWFMTSVSGHGCFFLNAPCPL